VQKKEIKKTIKAMIRVNVSSFVLDFEKKYFQTDMKREINMRVIHVSSG